MHLVTFAGKNAQNQLRAWHHLATSVLATAEKESRSNTWNSGLHWNESRCYLSRKQSIQMLRAQQNPLLGATNCATYL